MFTRIRVPTQISPMSDEARQALLEINTLNTQASHRRNARLPVNQVRQDGIIHVSSREKLVSGITSVSIREQDEAYDQEVKAPDTEVENNFGPLHGNKPELFDSTHGFNLSNKELQPGQSDLEQGCQRPKVDNLMPAKRGDSASSEDVGVSCEESSGSTECRVRAENKKSQQAARKDSCVNNSRQCVGKFEVDERQMTSDQDGRKTRTSPPSVDSSSSEDDSSWEAARSDSGFDDVIIPVADTELTRKWVGRKMVSSQKDDIETPVPANINSVVASSNLNSNGARSASTDTMNLNLELLSKSRHFKALSDRLAAKEKGVIDGPNKLSKPSSACEDGTLLNPSTPRHGLRRGRQVTPSDDEKRRHSVNMTSTSSAEPMTECKPIRLSSRPPPPATSNRLGHLQTPRFKPTSTTPRQMHGSKKTATSSPDSAVCHVQNSPAGGTFPQSERFPAISSVAAAAAQRHKEAELRKEEERRAREMAIAKIQQQHDMEQHARFFRVSGPGYDCRYEQGVLPAVEDIDEDELKLEEEQRAMAISKCEAWLRKDYIELAKLY